MYYSECEKSLGPRWALRTQSSLCIRGHEFSTSAKREISVKHLMGEWENRASVSGGGFGDKFSVFEKVEGIPLQTRRKEGRRWNHPN